MKAVFLKKVLTKANPLIDKILPVTECLLLDHGKVSIQSVGFEIQWKCDCKAEGEIDWDELKKIVKNFDNDDEVNFVNNGSDGKIDIILDNEVIGSLNSVLLKRDERLKPLEFNLKGRARFTTLYKEDLTHLKTAIGFVSNDDLRPAIKCISLGKHIAASDGHRLFFQEPIRELPSFMDSRFIEQETLTVKERASNILLHKSFAKLISDYEKNDVSIYINQEENKLENLKFDYKGEKEILYVNTNVCFILGDMTVFVKSIDEKYPDYVNVIPIKDESRNFIDVTFNRKELIKSCKLALGFANTITHRGILSFGEEEVILSAGDADYSREFKKPVKVLELITSHNVEKEVLIKRIGINLKLMIECLNISKNKDVQITFWNENRAMILDGNTLLMPAMIEEYA